MIGFFRRIRKKFADDNKPMKYFRYAIGEIILVVIGILIALSINNWNEDRKDRIKEQEYLIRLLDDFNEHIERFSFFKRLTTMRLAQIELLEDAVRDNKKGIEHGWKIIESIEKVTWSSYLPVSRNTYVELLSSGKMSLIKSDKLREYFVQYFDEIDHWEIVFESSEQQKEFAHLTAGLLSKELLLAIENTESLDYNEALVEPELELSNQEISEVINELSKNEQALNLLPKIYHYHILATKVMNHLEKKCNEIIALINTQLT